MRPALLKSIGEKHIPAIPSNLRILLLGQTVTLLPDEQADRGESAPATVLETVIRSDRHREQTMRDVKRSLFPSSKYADSSTSIFSAINGFGQYRRLIRRDQGDTPAEA